MSATIGSLRIDRASKDSEAYALWRMCRNGGEEAYKQEHWRRCGLILRKQGRNRKLVSANVYHVRCRPAGPSAQP